jgi:hypothetical protein
LVTRRTLILLAPALLLVAAIAWPARPGGVHASQHDAAFAFAKLKCKYGTKIVTKKVHGKKARVKVCKAKPKPTATPVPTDTATATPTNTPISPTVTNTPVASSATSTPSVTATPTTTAPILRNDITAVYYYDAAARTLHIVIDPNHLSSPASTSQSHLNAHQRAAADGGAPVYGIFIPGSFAAGVTFPVLPSGWTGSQTNGGIQFTTTTAPISAADFNVSCPVMNGPNPCVHRHQFWVYDPGEPSLPGDFPPTVQFSYSQGTYEYEGGYTYFHRAAGLVQWSGPDQTRDLSMTILWTPATSDSTEHIHTFRFFGPYWKTGMFAAPAGNQFQATDSGATLTLATDMVPNVPKTVRIGDYIIPPPVAQVVDGLNSATYQYLGEAAPGQ